AQFSRNRQNCPLRDGVLGRGAKRASLFRPRPKPQTLHGSASGRGNQSDLPVPSLREIFLCGATEQGRMRRTLAACESATRSRSAEAPDVRREPENQSLGTK